MKGTKKSMAVVIAMAVIYVFFCIFLTGLCAVEPTIKYQKGDTVAEIDQGGKYTFYAIHSHGLCERWEVRGPAGIVLYNVDRDAIECMLYSRQDEKIHELIKLLFDQLDNLYEYFAGIGFPVFPDSNGVK